MNLNRLRVVYFKTDTVIVHRRKGRTRIRSKFDIEYGYRGRWGTLCNVYNRWADINVTTDIEKVTCSKCLKRMEQL